MQIIASINSLKADNLKACEKCSRLLEYFSTEGKGGVIQILGEPLFPLKATIEFILKEFASQKLVLHKAIQKSKDKKKKLFPQSPYKANKHEKENS